MSLNVVDCTYNQYSLPSVSYLKAHSNNIVIRISKPIKEVYDYILGLLKFGVDVTVRIIKKNLCEPVAIMSSSDLKNVFEMLNALTDKEEK